MSSPPQQPSQRPVFSPSPGAYAVIRLNPLEMVKHLDDAEAVEQAKALSPRFHLVYLSMEMALPFPGRPWYRFEVSPIATKPREQSTKKGITPAMCIPIFPNTVHPNGRPPLRPEGVFPFNNCYHWLDNIIEVRVRARPEGFDETNVVRLSVDSMCDLDEIWVEDVIALASARRAAEASKTQDAAKDPHKQGPEVGGDLSDAQPADDAGHGSIASASSASCDEYVDDSAHLAGMDIFGGSNCDADLIPLVDLWISELSEHLKESEIPDPSDLFAECEQVMQIVRDARVRSYAKMTASVAPSSTETADEKVVAVQKHEPSMSSPSKPFLLPVFSPSPGAYAVIRLNPLEMVRHFDDAVAIEQAKALTPRFHLVYLSLEMALPFSGRPWYQFEVSPIATKLRKEDAKKGITPAMCIPIYPNTVHPTGRPPLRPEGVFPFKDCYHWLDNILQVRVRSRPEGFDETNAVKLSVDSICDLEEIWLEDYVAMASARRAARMSKPEDPEGSESDKTEVAKSAVSSLHAETAVRVMRDHSRRSLSDLPNTVPHDLPASSHECSTDDADRGSISSASSACSYEYADDSAHLAAMDIFSGPKCDADLVPLVDLWISGLSEHLKETDIPDPSDLFAECEQVVQIVRDARIRSYARMTAQSAPASTETADDKMDASEKIQHCYDLPAYLDDLKFRP
ncbi:hypothetical protein ACG7TL_008640 [Trametes sanguinea]